MTMMCKRMPQAMGLILALLILAASPAGAAADLFPVFDCIETNVAFWTRVYSQYPTSQGIVHDSERLDITYDIIDLMAYDAPGAHEINRKRMKKAVEKYERILSRLALEPEAADAEGRRVAALFADEHSPAVFRKAAKQVRCQTGQKDRFAAGLVRSGAYLDEIRSIFRSHDLPEDLAYLPHVESSFNPNAYSKFGAAGVWQFTRSTGRRFMAVGYALDERRDPLRATTAAAQLLKENYEKLGSWPLALTAYNHGAAGMERAKALHGEYPEIFKSYRGKTFKFASRNFYSEFLAARKVAGDYETYFGQLTLDRPLPTQTVVLEGFVPFTDLCRHFGLEPEVVKQMNPALRAPVVNGQKHIPKGYALRLPKDSEAAATTLLAGLPAAIYKGAQKPSHFYTVQRGDTAAKIARLHGIPIRDLTLANNLNPRATIYPQQTLRIPQPKESKADIAKIPEPKEPSVLLAAKSKSEPDTPAVAKTKEDNLPVEAQQAIPLIAEAKVENPPAEAEQAPPLMSEAEEENLPVEAEQTTPLMSEAEEENLPIEAEQTTPLMAEAEEKSLPAEAEQTSPLIAEAEPTVPAAVAEPSLPPPPAASEPAVDKPEPVSAPQPETEQFPAPMFASILGTPMSEPRLEAAEPAGAQASEAPNAEIVVADVRFEKFIQVKGQPVGILRVDVEETLGHYAEWAAVRTQKIRRLNALPFVTTLRLHQQIMIPLNKVTAQAFEESRYEYHKRLQEDFFAVYQLGQVQPYRVRMGDNYWSLSHEKFDVPLWLLKSANPQVDFADLRPNQEVMIPTIAKVTADEPAAVAEDEPEENGAVQ
jgi:membrane-bound lytic murein transglycosylase D